MKKLLLIFVCLSALPALSQTCSPFMGAGSIQALDNLGAPLTNGAIYFYTAGTSSQQATFTAGDCGTLNTNPVTFSTGGRAQIWLTTSAFYKVVWCSSSTDGPACAAGDTLAVVDNLPGGVTGGGGGGGAPFITNSANPATSGILRLASNDSVCWRNTANSANLCWSKDSNDLLSWAGGSFKEPEVGAPSSVTGFDILYADSTAHRYKQCSNGVACAQIVDAGVDVNTSDQVTQLHFGSTATPLSGTAPTTGQLLEWNGTNLVGFPQQEAIAQCGATQGLGLVQDPINCGQFVLANAHTLIRLMITYITQSTGCTTQPVVNVRDETAASTLATVTGANSTAFVDSGALSVAMTAGHRFSWSVSTAASGCTQSPLTLPSFVYQ